MHQRNPFYVLFTLTLAGLYFFVTGVLGWQVSGRNPIFFGGQWIDGPVWTQIGVGLVCFGGAALAYGRAARDPRLSPKPSVGTLIELPTASPQRRSPGR